MREGEKSMERERRESKKGEVSDWQKQCGWRGGKGGRDKKKLAYRTP